MHKTQICTKTQLCTKIITFVLKINLCWLIVFVNLFLSYNFFMFLQNDYAMILQMATVS